MQHLLTNMKDFCREAWEGSAKGSGVALSISSIDSQDQLQCAVSLLISAIGLLLLQTKQQPSAE